VIDHRFAAALGASEQLTLNAAAGLAACFAVVIPPLCGVGNIT